MCFVDDFIKERCQENLQCDIFSLEFQLSKPKPFLNWSQGFLPAYFLDDCVMLKYLVLLDIQPVNESIVFWPNASESSLPHKDPFSQIHNCPRD